MQFRLRRIFQWIWKKTDYLSISIGAHKMYGPKGIGLLGLKSGIDILPIQTGGGQENHLRAGTQNIPLIVGLSEAFKKSQTNIEYEST